MATYPVFSVRLPPSLIDDLMTAAERDGLTLNGFIVQAVAEKVAVLRARGMTEPLTPEERAAQLDSLRARRKGVELKDLLAKAGRAGLAIAGDELPEEEEASAPVSGTADAVSASGKPGMPDWGTW